jgi:hypothetical protein
MRKECNTREVVTHQSVSEAERMYIWASKSCKYSTPREQDARGFTTQCIRQKTAQSHTTPSSIPHHSNSVHSHSRLT